MRWYRSLEWFIEDIPNALERWVDRHNDPESWAEDFLTDEVRAYLKS